MPDTLVLAILLSLFTIYWNICLLTTHTIWIQIIYLLFIISNIIMITISCIDEKWL